jgi:hypothetical protein
MVATYTQNKSKHIHAFSGIRTYDPKVRVGEVGPCLRPRDQCDRLTVELLCMKYFFG